MIDHHLITLANETVSGLQPRWWIEKVVLVCEQEGRVDVPAFATPDGELALSIDHDSMFQRYLLRGQEETNLVPSMQWRQRRLDQWRRQTNCGRVERVSAF